MPNVRLEALQFYDGGPSGALLLRRNYQTPLTYPEWHLGGVNGPLPVAAYPATLAGQPVYIYAKLTLSGGASGTYWVKADGGDVLGNIPERKVTFVNGVTVPEYIPIPLPNHNIGGNGVQWRNAVWNWYFATNDSNAPWQPMIQTTHRVYVTLAAPSLPWRQYYYDFYGSTQIPWTDALDYACWWAQGAQNAADAASAITYAINQYCGLTYDTVSGASNYTYNTNGGSFFLLSNFIAYLIAYQNGFGLMGMNVVNCTDCATIVSTFANALGCDLTQARMQGVAFGQPAGFSCNKIVAIGGNNWDYPFPPGNGFFYHEVAWTFPYNGNGRIYDACLLLDQGNDPWDWVDPNIVHVSQLPRGMVFTTQPAPPILPLATPFATQTYRERLAQNTQAGIGNCFPVGTYPGSQNGRRWVI